MSLATIYREDFITDIINRSLTARMMLYAGVIASRFNFSPVHWFCFLFTILPLLSFVSLSYPPLFLCPPFSPFFVQPPTTLLSFVSLSYLPHLFIPLSIYTPLLLSPSPPSLSLSAFPRLPSPPPSSLPAAPSPLCRALKALNPVTVERLCDLAPS